MEEPNSLVPNQRSARGRREKHRNHGGGHYRKMGHWCRGCARLRWARPGAGGRERRHPEAAGQAHVVELMWDAIFYDEDALHLHRYYLQVHK
jgi:hypothetical protein